MYMNKLSSYIKIIPTNNGVNSYKVKIVIAKLEIIDHHHDL
mgnify:CR=1 FL=1